LKKLNISLAGAFVLSVAACSAPDPATEVPSVGLFDAVIPAGADFDAIPEEGQVLITEWDSINRNGVLDIAPNSNATFSGNFVAGIDETEGTVLFGDAEIKTNFDSSRVNATFDNVTVSEGGIADPLFGSFGMTNGLLSDGEYAGALTGTLSEGPDDYVIDGLLAGAFTDANETIGLIIGDVTNPDTTVDTFGGYFVATELP